MGHKLIGTMEITTVIGCKNMCVYCPQSTLIKRYKDINKEEEKIKISYDDFKTCLNKIPRNIRIDFSGMAEPWLNPDCTKMLLYAHQKGFRISVYTTAVGMSFDDIELIKDILYERFIIHLASIADKNVRPPSDPTHLEKIHKLSTSKIKNIGFVSHGKVHPNVRKSLKFPIYESSIMSRAKNLESYQLDNNVQKHNRFFQDKLLGKISCLSCFSLILHSKLLNRNVLLPNGDVVLCCMDYGLRHILGNLLTSDYQDLFKSSEYRKLQKGLDDDSMNILCRQCENAAPRLVFFKERLELSVEKLKYVIKRLITWK